MKIYSRVNCAFLCFQWMQCRELQKSS